MYVASKEQLAEFISFLHGHVASLLRHMVGSAGMVFFFKLLVISDSSNHLLFFFPLDLSYLCNCGFEWIITLQQTSAVYKMILVSLVQPL